MKGIILAGGKGTRLHPCTIATCKQLLPVYNKPMVYFPLSLLMLAGIQEILVITNPHDQHAFQLLLRDGGQWGLQFSYIVQPEPTGLAEAFILGETFIGADQVCLVLGDNILFGHGLSDILQAASKITRGAEILAYPVRDPERYGVVEFDENQNVINIVEKPLRPKSNFAVPGLYFYDNQVVEVAKSLSPSSRGLLEITDINNFYLRKKQLSVQIIGRGFAWLDAGTPDSLLQASNFVQTIEERQGLMIACPEEIAYNLGYITAESVVEQANQIAAVHYREYLMRLINEGK
jgi:glucose-1-phosphate thymidylyltransferase